MDIGNVCEGAVFPVTGSPEAGCYPAPVDTEE